jgi:type I restriction-modification system DNA methylase subunit
MSEELLQRGLLEKPEKIGKWDFYNIGATTLKALKENKIIPNIDYKDFEKRKPDGIMVSKRKVFLVVENKKPSELKTDALKKKAIKQGLGVAQKLKAKILIVTDTKQTIWINAMNGDKITDEAGNLLKAVFSHTGESTAKLVEKVLDSIDETNSQLSPPKIKDPSPLAKQVWQDIWSVSGATAENCLYTFVELFVFKYLSDLGVLPGIYNFDHLLKQYETNSDEEVLEFYANVIRKKIKELFPMNPKDKTTIINGTIFVSKDEKAVQGYSTVFKKILEKFEREGKLQNIHYDFKSKIFESFLKESISKKNWGQFFTPLKVVRAICNMVEIKEGMTICDPACGVGKFLLEPILKDIDRFYKVENGKLKPKIKLVGFDKGFDKDEQKTIILAKANMLIYLSELIKDSPNITEQFSELFNDTFLLKTNSILGTLSEEVNEAYDLILTNPPYVISGSRNLKEEIVKSGLAFHYNVNGVGVEGLFMEWIVKALKPGGKAIVVIPDGLLSRPNDKALRKFILDECSIDSVISLPSKTFFTTLKKTYILSLTKKNDKTVPQKDPVFTYLVSDIGESLDIYRLEIPENDLEEASVLFNQFKGAKAHFKSKDERCKIVPPSFFETNYDKSWIIENLWSEDALIGLGMKEKEVKINVDEFANYLEDLTVSINEYQQQLNTITSNTNDYKEISITDSEIFEFYSGTLGMKKNDYAPLDTKNERDIPVYTATLNPVAYFKAGTISKVPYEASKEVPHISFANDGEGTAATNIVFHTQPYYLNTSRSSFSILNENIDPEYIFFSIQDIKRKYGFDFNHKANMANLKKVIIKIPVDLNGEFDLNAQRELAAKNKIVTSLKRELKSKFDQINLAKIELN